MWEIFFICLCIILNAVLAGIEMAFVTVNKAFLKHLARKGDKKAKSLLLLKEKPERVLSTIQIGITFLGSLTAAVGGAAAGVNIIPLLHEKFHLNVPIAELIAIIFVVAPITYFSVVIGEITPKALALRNPYFFATLGIPLLKILTKFLYPLVRFSEVSTQFILEIMPCKSVHDHDQETEYHDYEKLFTSYLRMPKKGKEYMVNLGNIEEKNVKDILLQWNQVDYVTVDQDVDEVEEKIISSGHTRMPVIKTGQVVGLINTKEILAFSRGKDTDWKKLMREPVKFRKENSLLDALNTLRGKRIHMGIVEDDYNKPLGIITIEDIIEEVLGEIYDEDDEGRLKKILNKEK